MIRINPFKKILLIASLFSNIGALEYQLLRRVPSDEIATIGHADTQLVGSYEAHEMRWVPEMYAASGLTNCMSKECFMINALAKIKESMDDYRCCPGLRDYVQSCNVSKEEVFGGLFALNVTSSAFALLHNRYNGLVNGAEKPMKFPENHCKYRVYGCAISIWLQCRYGMGRNL